MAGIVRGTTAEYFMAVMREVGANIQQGNNELATEIFNKHAAPFITDFEPYIGGNSFQLDPGGERRMLVDLKAALASKTLSVSQKLREIEMIVNRKVRVSPAVAPAVGAGAAGQAAAAPVAQNNQPEYMIPILPEWLLSTRKAAPAKAASQAPAERKEENKTPEGVPAPLAFARGVRLEPLRVINSQIMPSLSLDGDADAAPDFYDDQLFADARSQKFAPIPAAPEFQRKSSDEDPDLLAAIIASLQ